MSIIALVLASCTGATLFALLRVSWERSRVRVALSSYSRHLQPSAHDRIAFVSDAAGSVHFFPRTPWLMVRAVAQKRFLEPFSPFR